MSAFQPTWRSLARYRVPRWYRDAKLGVFIHWGPYAVPAFGNEWYPRNMYRPGTREFAHHRKVWGDQREFGYKDFIPLFRAERFDAEDWAGLFRDAGARYVVPVAEHHDGFAMYDSAHTWWSSVHMGPRRDVLGELARAVRARGMKLGASSHYAFNWFYYVHSPRFDTVEEIAAGLYGEPHDVIARPSRRLPAEERQRPPGRRFLDHWYARTLDIVDRYRPDLMYFDFGFLRPEFEPYRRRFGADYYNRARRWGTEVVLNHKYEGYPYGAAVLDRERGRFDEIRPIPWQTDTSVSWNSWGYVEGDDVKSAASLIHVLADVTGKNGCLLLNVGPKADGTIPAPVRRVLLEIGRWLEVNGEAIYGTRPWRKAGEGPTALKGDDWNERRDFAYTASDVRFTTRGRYLYAIVLGWPGREARIRSLGRDLAWGARVRDVSMLGASGRPAWRQERTHLAVRMPGRRPCDHAFSLRIRLSHSR